MTSELMENKMGLSGDNPNEFGPSLIKHDGPSIDPPNVSTGDHVGPNSGPNDAKSELGRPEITQQSHGDTPLAKDIFL